MNAKQIQNAYIKNKPNYNYEIVDLDNVLIAKGHLLNTKEKLKVLKHMNYDIDLKGEVKYNIDSMVDFYAEWVTTSITEWIWKELPITNLTINNLDFEVVKWLSEQIQLKNSLSVLKVELNEKN